MDGERSEAFMKTIAATVLLLAALIVAGLVVWTVAYSHRQGLSDRELISIAAGKEARRRIGSVRYSSSEDLINRNPTCCVVLHSNHEWLQFPYQIFEQGDAVVVMNYVVSIDQGERYYSAETAISSTGDVLQSRGIATNMPSR